MNVISFLDGNLDLLEIAEKCQVSYGEVLSIVERLKFAGLLDRI